MKTNTIEYLLATLVPAALLVSGCKTPCANQLTPQTSSSLAGARVVVETSHLKGLVTEVVPDRRELALRSSAGAVTRCKIAPNIENLNEVHVGAKVAATSSQVVAVFLLKNGTPPSAGGGVTLTSGGPMGQAPSVVLQTRDARAKVLNADRSYRLLKLEYADGSKKEYKFPLPDTLQDIKKGDEALVRITEPLAICIKTE